MNSHLISLMILLPVLGAIAQACLPALGKGVQRAQLSPWISGMASLLASLCGVALVISMRAPVAELQASEILPWVGAYAISYDMGVDGLNALLVLLVSIIFPLLIAAEWSRKHGLKGMHGLLLMMQAALFGAVCAQDAFLLFFFWAMSAIPFYFLIGIWGGPRRESAAFKQMITSALGNALIFGALLLVYYSIDPHTFSLRELAGGKLEGKTFVFLGSELSVSMTAFLLVSVGLALRIPLWPFHGWFTEVAEEAPSTTFVALSAILVPIGTYVFFRLTSTLFPSTFAQVAHQIVLIGALNLAIGGICAAAQKGLRLMLAYLSIAAVGLILIGMGSLSSAGVVGAVYQQLSWGLGIAGFGLFTGMVYDRTGSALFLNESREPLLGGVVTQAPMMALMAGMVVASLLGFPGLTGFVGQSLLVIGIYPVHPAVVLLAGFILILAAYYLFTMYRFIFLGQASPGFAGFSDLTLRERAYSLPLLVLILIFGIYPQPLIELVRPTVLTLLSTIK